MIQKADAMTAELRQNMRGGNGSVQVLPLMATLPEKARLFATLTLESGCSIGYHQHENETELFYFIQGTARVQDDGETYVANAGDAMSTPSGHGHSVENIGNDVLKLLAVIIKD